MSNDAQTAQTLVWVKSSYTTNLSNCVEVARTTMGMAIQDSKRPTGHPLSFTAAQWQAFVSGDGRG